MHVMYSEGANREGGGMESRKWAILVPHIVAVARTEQA